MKQLRDPRIIFCQAAPPFIIFHYQAFQKQRLRREAIEDVCVSISNIILDTECIVGIYASLTNVVLDVFGK